MEEMEKKLAKYKKKILRLRHKPIRKRRCSNCLHSGHTKRNCNKQAATYYEKKLYKFIKMKRY